MLSSFFAFFSSSCLVHEDKEKKKNYFANENTFPREDSVNTHSKTKILGGKESWFSSQHPRFIISVNQIK